MVVPGVPVNGPPSVSVLFQQTLHSGPNRLPGLGQVTVCPDDNDYRTWSLTCCSTGCISSSAAMFRRVFRQHH